MKKPYLHSTTKSGICCQTEITWGQWLANRAAAAWAWLTRRATAAWDGKRGHF